MANNPQSEPFIVLCKAYVRFMVENPRFYYLMHVSPLTNSTNAVASNMYKEYFSEYADLFWEYLSRCGIQNSDHLLITSLFASILDGIVSLLIKKHIRYEGDYTELVDRIIIDKLKLRPVSSGV